MILFHFSGTPGTGKTFLCELVSKILQKHPNYKTLDTDDWLYEWHTSVMQKAKSGREARDLYEKFMNSKIATFESSPVKWILCGVLNYEFTVRGRLLRMPELSWPSNAKLVFIKIDTDKLYKQRAIRALRNICEHREDIEKDLESGAEVLIDWELSETKDYVRKAYQFDLEYHLQRGYALKTQAQAISIVKKLVKK